MTQRGSRNQLPSYMRTIKMQLLFTDRGTPYLGAMATHRRTTGMACQPSPVTAALFHHSISGWRAHFRLSLRPVLFLHNIDGIFFHSWLAKVYYPIVACKIGRLIFRREEISSQRSQWCTRQRNTLLVEQLDVLDKFPPTRSPAQIHLLFPNKLLHVIEYAPKRLRCPYRQRQIRSLLLTLYRDNTNLVFDETY